MNVQEKYIQTKKILNSNDTESFENEARLILSHVLSVEPNKILCSFFDLSEEQEDQIDFYVKGRISGRPLQYVLNIAYFYGREFYVDENVLIPRNETELLCEYAIKIIKEHKYINALDMCCGSGCIGLTLNSETKTDVTLSDISDEALKVARKNAEKDNCNVNIINSNLFENINGKFDFIISNPPYIKTNELKNLEVAKYEPNLALNGGNDGLKVISEIIAHSGSHLTKNSALVLEIGYNQGEDVKTMLNDYGFSGIEIINDYNNFNRIAIGYKHD